MSLILDGSVGVSDVDGSAATPAIRGTDANTGMFFPAADTIAFSEGGVESMRIDSAGNVGIATASPSTFGKFAVQGASTNRVFYADSLAQPVARYDDNSFINAGFTLRNTGITGANQGIGIQFLLGASGTAVDSGAIQMRSEGDFSTGATQDAAMAFSTVLNGSSGERMRIDSAGRVGIGTSTIGVAYTLSVNGTGNFYNGVSGLGRVFFGDPSDSSGYIGIYRSSLGPSNSTTVGNGLNFASFDGYTFNTGVAVFGSQTERMRIDSSGRLCINKTSGDVTNTVLEVNGISNAVCSSWKIGTNGFKIMQFNNQSNTEAGQIIINSGSVAYGTSSDYRLKENIAPMTGALAKVAQLKPVTYNWKADGSDGQGFIAHELQAVVPDCVTGEKDAVDAEGNPVYQGIDTSFLVATLTAAIQEQQAMIEELKAKVAALEAA
jgi:hypothetical protein